MNLIILSDTHSRQKDIEIPDGDVLIHCGDMTNRGNKLEIIEVAEWLESFPHKDKIVVAGNHDFICQSDPRWTKEIFRKYDITYLQDEYTMIRGYSYKDVDGVHVIKDVNLKFYGSPWTPMFGNWSFMKYRGASIREVWNAIPKDTDVLITHGPPMGVLDWSVYSYEHVGCEELMEAVIRVQPMIHCFGHIHSGYGQLEKYNTKFINAAILNEHYQVENQPQVIEI